ncbi:hypothetical protein AB0I68_17735 [Streptomyces sp. NPDC050448]|uniref:hypothetical protein n=1 Tax=Streptomyces sp. NPDC050448 TaxID=3155404 RepID=UPI00343EBC9C
MRAIHGFRPLWLAGTVLMAVTSIAGCDGSGSTGGGAPARSPSSSFPNISGPEPSLPPLPGGSGAGGSGGDPAKPVDFQGGGAVIRPDGSMTFPLDAYDSAEDEAVLARAETALGEECMRTKGLELPASLRMESGPAQPAPYVLFGVIDMETVKVSGYREPSPPGAPADSRAAPSASPSASPAPSPAAGAPAGPGAGAGAGNSPAQDSGEIAPAVAEAFFDDPRKGKVGCEGQARAKVHGQDPQTLFTLLQDYRSEALAAAQGDSRVRAATARWSGCMKDAGFNYPDPLAPGHDRTLLGRGLPTPAGATLPPPSPAEIEVAVADITCKRRTQYLQTVALADAAYQQQIIGKQGQRLRAAQQEQKQHVEAAGKILAAGR